MKVIAPKPGVYKGIKFRSQLEIKWAKYFEKAKQKYWKAKYVDTDTHDFVVESTSQQCCVEIKPHVERCCINAIDKIDFDHFSSGDSWCVVIGPPPSPYGRPLVAHFAFHNMDEMDGPFSDLCAIVRIGEIAGFQELWSTSLIPFSDTCFNVAYVLSRFLWDESRGEDGSNDISSVIIDELFKRWPRHG